MSYDTNNFHNFNNYGNELPTSTPRGGAASSAALNSDFRKYRRLGQCDTPKYYQCK